MYNATVLTLFSNPHNMRLVPDANAIGQDGLPGEGPYMTLYLRIQTNQIMETGFETYGCPAAIACGSWLTQWLIGKTSEQAQTIDANDLILVLGGLPLGKEHCAVLAVNALKSALKSR